MINWLKRKFLHTCHSCGGEGSVTTLNYNFKDRLVEAATTGTCEACNGTGKVWRWR
jgi:DnaJ-class molecular chaperone